MKGNCEMTLAAVIALIVFATGCGDQGRLRQALGPSGQSGLADPGNEKALEHFWFTYRGQPDPGRRVWMRTSADVWSELYPNGTVSKYKRSGRARVNGEEGTTVQKIEGDVRNTLTPNDGSFEVFIPDRTATNRILFIHSRGKDGWNPWRAVVPLTPLE
jgi:hypothetical protein